MKNAIEKPLDDLIGITFSFTSASGFTDLNDFTRIELEIGGEVYKTNTTPDEIYIDPENPKRLIINIGPATQLARGSYQPTIKGYSATYDDGFPLCSKNNKRLGPIIIY